MEANTALTNVNTEIAKIQKEIIEDTKTDQKVAIQAEAGKLQGEMNKALADGTIAQETVKTQIKQTQANLVATYLEMELKRANIEYTKEQTKAIADQIAQGYINAFANRRNANTNETNADTNLHRQIKDALYQNGILELGDRKLNQDLILGTADILTGVKPNGVQFKGYR